MAQWGMSLIPEDKIPREFFEDNDLSSSQIYDKVKTYMAMKYGAKVLRNYHWTPEVDQLVGMLIQRSSKMKYLETWGKK